MSFGEALNKSIKKVGCTPSELAHAAGVSTALISRYLNDKRTPRKNSEQLNSIINGLIELAEEKDIKLNYSEISDELNSEIELGDLPYESFTNNFNSLVSDLKINTSDLAYNINYNASFISRIKNGTRRPANLENFIDRVSEYVIRHFASEEDRKFVAAAINCSADELATDKLYKQRVALFLSAYQDEKNESVGGFLEKLNSFDYNSFSRASAKIRVPSTPIIPGFSKVYYDVKGMQEAEKDFFKFTLISKSKADVLIYSDIPMNELDDAQMKKLVSAVTALVSRGVRLNLIHTINRPMKEMLLGLETWIPIYMTGMASPYYFENAPANLFSIMLATSGAAALSADCEKGRQSTTRITMTTRREDVEYFNRRAEYMISKSKPLMKIYPQEKEAELAAFIESESAETELEIIRKPQLANIEFTLCRNKWIMLKKLDEPSISFVIFNDNLRRTIENYISY